jgi:NAD(P)-dependent dehydrogenase (short-subunit alcohol dehydrogenase family)
VPVSLGKHATAQDVTAGIDLRGKTAVVTGVNAGLGHETMRVLALRGAHVLGTARSGDAGQRACSGIAGRASPLVLDLADFESVAHCADQIRAMQIPVDMLICNAGIMQRRIERVRGLEKHFVVNHLGHFILVNRLQPQIEAAEQGRVVVVGSEAHRAARTGIELDNLTGERGFPGLRAYGHSKLANGLFSLELARRLAGTRATSNAVHPGVVRTQIARYLPRWQRAIFDAIGPWMLKTVAEGAATICYVAADPGLAGVSGRYFADCRSVQPSPWMQDEAMAAKLWSVSERLTREFLL